MENRKKFLYFPTAENNLRTDSPRPIAPEVVGDAPCPCCGYITIPNQGDALAYICPVCLWEIDLFIGSEEEPSDQNHGLSLKEARENYKACGAVLPRLVQYARKPKESEISK